MTTRQHGNISAPQIVLTGPVNGMLTRQQRFHGAAWRLSRWHTAPMSDGRAADTNGQEPDDDPPIPFEPLAPGELVSMLVGNGSVAESDLPAASRADLAAYRVARTAPSAAAVAEDMPAAEQAARALAGLVHRLTRIADSPESDPAEVTAAMNQLRQIAAGHDPGATDTRTAPELTRAELQRIARGGLADAGPER